MSSSDEANDKTNGSELKRPKMTSRACDRCWRKKIRCDALDKPGVRCTNCSIRKIDCTFERSGKRGPSKGYIRDLEKRCEALEKLLARVAPHVNITEEIGPSFNEHTWLEVKAKARSEVTRMSATVCMDKLPSPAATLPPSPTLNPTLYPSNSIGLPVDLGLEGELSPSEMSNTDNEERAQADNYIMGPLEEAMTQLNINGFQRRFHGKSAGVYICQTALALGEHKGGGSVPQISFGCFRPRFWKAEPWELSIPQLPNPAKFLYPPEDLADELVDLTFKHVLSICPLIHRPTFDAQRRSKLHLRNIAFARVYLLVCANGAPYSSDGRTCIPGEDGKPQWGSAGWMYFSQVLNMRWPVLAAATQSDLQVTIMMALYLQSTSLSHASWLIGGLALRAALDIGLHRERVYSLDTPFNAQMWRRIFWSLITFDRLSSAHFGRSVMINEEDIDAELPLEVDDEYYDEEQKIWKQPQDKPAAISVFFQHLKLMGILSRGLRSFFSINKHKVHHGYIGDEWESRTMADLDSDLNSWLNSLPDHLKWDGKSKDDDDLFHRSTYLRLMYYWTQMTIHRPFIPPMSVSGKTTSLSLPSLAICMNVVKAASHAIEEYGNRGFVDGPMICVAHNFACVHVISMHGLKGGDRREVSKLTEDIQRFASYLRKVEKRWYLAGKLHDILLSLTAAHGIVVTRHDDEPRTTSISDQQQTRIFPSDVASIHLFAASASLSSGSADLRTEIQRPFELDMSHVHLQHQTSLTPASTAPSVLPSTSSAVHDPIGWNGLSNIGTAAYPTFVDASSFSTLNQQEYDHSGFSYAAPSNGMLPYFSNLEGLGTASAMAMTDEQFMDVFKTRLADEWSWFNQMTSGD